MRNFNGVILESIIGKKLCDREVREEVNSPSQVSKTSASAQSSLSRKEHPERFPPLSSFGKSPQT